ncbi:unnamed protein product, partial [Prunus brigantina]
LVSRRLTSAKKYILKCDHYGEMRHTIDICWALHGVPDGEKERRRFKKEQLGDKAHVAAVATSVADVATEHNHLTAITVAVVITVLSTPTPPPLAPIMGVGSVLLTPALPSVTSSVLLTPAKHGLFLSQRKSQLTKKNIKVMWRSKKQNVVSRSSVESEHRGIAQGSAFEIANNPVQHDRTKHVEVDRNFIKEKLEHKLISIPFVPSSNQLANMLTHAMSKRQFEDSLDKLTVSINVMPTGGQLTIAANLTKDELGQSVHLVHLELRITRAGGGIPEGLLNQMFGNNVGISEERNGLLVRSKLVKLRNGDVMYLREAGKATFMISVELAAAQKLSLIIDFFEPVKPYEVPMTALLLGPCSHTSLQLKQLPDCSLCLVERLCDTMVQEVFELTGYDRVMMAYKFHDDDDHGEVVKVLQDEKLPFDLTLCCSSSTLRAPHSCHPQYMKN